MLRSALLFALFAFSSEASPATTARVAEAMEAQEPPVIDGVVEDAIWATAQVITDFVQAEPYEGEPPTEKTEVRLLYDETNLYLGVICYDTDPAGIITTDSRRDSSLDDTDSFRVVFDTYLDRQNGFVFGTNPAGIEYDGQVTNEGEGGGGGGPGSGRAQGGSGGGFNLNWDASFVVRSHAGDFGWSAEFAIPLRTLRYESAKPQIWGLNFQRNIRRKREETYWSPISRIYSLNRLSSAGELRGLELETPRNFKVTPYVLGSSERDYVTTDENDLDGELGVDAKVGVTPSLNLDLTYDTDFALVEVDEQQINLTRFNLFFPEKRPFFLENAGNFAMGKNRDVELFFSRRIGIGPEGGIVPILGGARFSGKAGQYNLGVLNMQTEEVAGVAAANNYTVASLSRELPNRSSVGALFVNRLATGDLAGDDDWNRTYGFDGKLGIGDPFTLSGFAAGTDTPGLEGRQHALNVRGEYQKRKGRVWLGATEVGGDFNPEVGFLTRDDYRNLETGFFLNIRNDISWLRELRPHVTYDGFWNFDGFKETERIQIDSHVDFENGAFFSPAFNHTVEKPERVLRDLSRDRRCPGKLLELGGRLALEHQPGAAAVLRGRHRLRGLSLRRSPRVREHRQLPLPVEGDHLPLLVLQRRRPSRRKLRHQPRPVQGELQLHAAHLPPGPRPVQRSRRRLVVEHPLQLAKYPRERDCSSSTTTPRVWETCSSVPRTGASSSSTLTSSTSSISAPSRLRASRSGEARRSVAKAAGPH